jgi:hypothetical protein
MKVDKNETSRISVNEVRNLDPKSIKVINLVDGSKIIINNNESSQNQNQPETTGKPIFTEVKDQEIINKYLSQTNSTQKHQCRCHQHHVQEQMQNNQTWESQNENYSNYQYYQQEPNMSQSQETGGTQKLRNVNGPLMNDMITYNEQGNNNGQYYSGEEGFVETDENGQGINQYPQPQSENYYVNPQVYDQNVQGEMQENEYQPEQGYEQGYDYQQGYGYDQNQEQYPPQEDQNKNEENNVNEPRTTVEEIITKDVNEEKKDEDKKDEEINNEEKNEEKNEEENKKENEEEKEENNVIQNKEDENQNPLPEVNDMISGDANKEQNEEQGNEKKEEIEKNEENNNNVEDNKENVNENEQPKKEGYYYVQDGEKYPQEDQAQEQNQEEFKENEYKGDEEEAEAEKNNQKKEEVPKKVEETGPNSGVPRPKIPVVKIQYYEYPFPKRIVKPPFPGRPIKFLFEEKVFYNGGRSQSNPHTMNPSFGRIFPRPHIIPKRDFIPPMHRFPPRPLFIPPQMSFYQPRPQIFPPRMPQFPPRPQFMPPHMHYHGPHFAPPLKQHFPHTQQFSLEKQRFPPRPQLKNYPQPQQRYAYPSPHRRFEEFDESFQPLSMNKTNYFSERNIFSPMGSNLSFNKGNFYSYKVMRPQTTTQNRSVSNSKSDGRFATYSYGIKKPKQMFRRVDNRRIARATGAKLNTQKA